MGNECYLINMEAGRELDALIAEKVMGLRLLERNFDINKGDLVNEAGCGHWDIRSGERVSFFQI